MKAGILGGLSLGGYISASAEDTVARITSGVNRASSPSKLKITDLRFTLVEHLERRIPLLRIDTNQGIYGLGEVRDGGDERYALILKSRLLGENPCNVEKLFRIIKPFGGHGRLGGGVSGVEMALWDLAGKAYGVPCWQLLGGRYRSKVRLYADTHGDKDFEKIKAQLTHRIEAQGFTWLKMTRCWNVQDGLPKERRIPELVRYLATVREHVGYDIPISADHFLDRDANTMIRMGKALDPYGLAWLEEVIEWDLPQQLRAVAAAIDTPIAAGENIYLKETFQELCDLQAIDYVHPDLATVGGMLESKKIGDYAETKGIRMAMHFAGTPVSFMASVHCAAATNNFDVLEFHPEDIDQWAKMVETVDGGPLITRGFANVPNEAPGLGIVLNEEEVRKVQHPSNRTYFSPTNEWNEPQSSDTLGIFKEK